MSLWIWTQLDDSKSSHEDNANHLSLSLGDNANHLPVVDSLRNSLELLMPYIHLLPFIGHLNLFRKINLII